jgi:hypothetical protein
MQALLDRSTDRFAADALLALHLTFDKLVEIHHWCSLVIRRVVDADPLIDFSANQMDNIAASGATYAAAVDSVQHGVLRR